MIFSLIKKHVAIFIIRRVFQRFLSTPLDKTRLDVRRLFANSSNNSHHSSGVLNSKSKGHGGDEGGEIRLDNLELNISTINDEILVNTSLKLERGHLEHVEIRFNPFSASSSTWSPRFIPNLIKIHGLSLTFTLRDSPSEQSVPPPDASVEPEQPQADDQVLSRSIILGTVSRQDIEEILSEQHTDLDDEDQDPEHPSPPMLDDADEVNGLDPQKIAALMDNVLSQMKAIITNLEVRLKFPCHAPSENSSSHQQNSASTCHNVLVFRVPKLDISDDPTTIHAPRTAASFSPSTSPSTANSSSPPSAQKSTTSSLVKVASCDRWEMQLITEEDPESQTSIPDKGSHREEDTNTIFVGNTTCIRFQLLLQQHQQQQVVPLLSPTVPHHAWSVDIRVVTETAFCMLSTSPYLNALLQIFESIHRSINNGSSALRIGVHIHKFNAILLYERLPEADCGSTWARFTKDRQAPMLQDVFGMQFLIDGVEFVLAKHRADDFETLTTEMEIGVTGIRVLEHLRTNSSEVMRFLPPSPSTLLSEAIPLKGETRSCAHLRLCREGREVTLSLHSSSTCIMTFDTPFLQRLWEHVICDIQLPSSAPVSTITSSCPKTTPPEERIPVEITLESEQLQNCALDASINDTIQIVQQLKENHDLEQQILTQHHDRISLTHELMHINVSLNFEHVILYFHPTTPNVDNISKAYFSLEISGMTWCTNFTSRWCAYRRSGRKRRRRSIKRKEPDPDTATMQIWSAQFDNIRVCVHEKAPSSTEPDLQCASTLFEFEPQTESASLPKRRATLDIFTRDNVNPEPADAHQWAPRSKKERENATLQTARVAIVATLPAIKVKLNSDDIKLIQSTILNDIVRIFTFDSVEMEAEPNQAASDRTNFRDLLVVKANSTKCTIQTLLPSLLPLRLVLEYSGLFQSIVRDPNGQFFISESNLHSKSISISQQQGESFRTILKKMAKPLNSNASSNAFEVSVRRTTPAVKKRENDTDDVQRHATVNVTLYYVIINHPDTNPLEWIRLFTDLATRSSAPTSRWTIEYRLLDCLLNVKIRPQATSFPILLAVTSTQLKLVTSTGNASPLAISLQAEGFSVMMNAWQESTIPVRENHRIVDILWKMERHLGFVKVLEAENLNIQYVGGETHRFECTDSDLNLSVCSDSLRFLLDFPSYFRRSEDAPDTSSSSTDETVLSPPEMSSNESGETRDAGVKMVANFDEIISAAAQIDYFQEASPPQPAVPLTEDADWETVNGSWLRKGNRNKEFQHSNLQIIIQNCELTLRFHEGLDFPLEREHARIEASTSYPCDLVDGSITTDIPDEPLMTAADENYVVVVSQTAQSQHEERALMIGETLTAVFDRFEQQDEENSNTKEHAGHSRRRDSVVEVHMTGAALETTFFQSTNGGTPYIIFASLEELCVMDQIRTSKANRLLEQLRTSNGGSDAPRMLNLFIDGVFQQSVSGTDESPQHSIRIKFECAPLKIDLDERTVEFLQEFFTLTAVGSNASTNSGDLPPILFGKPRDRMLCNEFDRHF